MVIKSTAIASVLALTFNVAAAESNFDGFYAGLHTGYASGKDKGTQFDDGLADGFTQETSPKGSLFGGLAGYNIIFENNMLLGVEADYEYRGKSDSTFQKDAFNPTEQLYTAETKLKDTASVRARIGYVFNEGKTLGYLTAGYAAANIERTIAYANPADNFSTDVNSETHSKWQNGWTAGFGAEHFIDEKFSLKLEYRYSDFSRTTVSSEQVFGTGYEQKQKYQNDHSVRVGVLYHF